MDLTIFYISMSSVNLITCLLLFLFVKKIANFERVALCYYAIAAVVNYVAVTAMWKLLGNIAFSYHFGDYNLMAILGVLAVIFSFAMKSKSVKKCTIVESVFLILIACGVCWAYIVYMQGNVGVYFSNARLFLVLVLCFLPILYILLFALKRVEGLLVFGICNIVIAIYFVYHMYGLLDYEGFYFMFFMYISDFLFSLVFAYISLRAYFDWRDKLSK